MDNIITLTFDKPRKVQIDIGTLKLLQKHTGKSFFSGEMFKNPDDYLDLMTDFVYCALVRAGEEINIEDIDSIIHIKNVVGIFEGIKKELHEFMPMIKAHMKKGMNKENFQENQ